MTASIELEQLYRQRKSWEKLVELLLARTEFTPDAATRIQLLMQVAEIYEQQLGDHESAFVTLQAAFREDYSNDHVAKELERLATATDKWNELIGEYTQVVQGIADPKQAADLWVKIGRWYDSALRHVDYAIASAQQALQLDNAHIGALQALEDFYRKQKQLDASWSARWPATPSASRRRRRASRSCWPLADTYETQLGDATQAMAAYQRALDADEHCIDAINALERLYRRTQAWDRLVDVLAKKAQVVDDTEQAIRLKLQVGELWEDRLGDNDRAVDAYKEVLSVDPQNLPALKALDGSTRRPGAWRSTSRSSSTSSRCRRPRRSASRSTSAWRRSGRSTSASPTAPPRCWRRSSSSTTATRRRTATSSGSIARSASGSRWSRPTASTSRSRPTRPSASSCTPRWARSTRRSCATSTAPSRRTTTSSPSRTITPTRWPAWRACTRRPSSGTAPSR